MGSFTGRACVLAAVLIASGASAALTAAAPTCFGHRATIVGTNRDPGRSVALNGTRGDDVIVGLRGVDRIRGRGGHDLICAGDGDDFIRAGVGNDRVRGQAGLDTIYGGGGRDRQWGGSGGGDALLGGPGNDRLFGGRGTEDSLIGGPGEDHLNGGRGYDLAEFWESRRGVQADLRDGTATGRGRDMLAAIEGIIGSPFDDVLHGDEYSNMLQGGGGNDTIHAYGSSADGGIDVLRSAGGDTVLDGGEGPDIASYNLVPWPVVADLSTRATTSDFGTDMLVGIEHLIGSRENDTLIGDDQNNMMMGNWGNDVLDGRDGVDEIAFLDSLEPVTADLATGESDGGLRSGTDSFVNFENLTGSAWSDTLMGDEDPNEIRGGSRNDLLVGHAGDDLLLGGPGSDEADGGDGTDQCEAEVQSNCERELSLQLIARTLLPHVKMSSNVASRTSKLSSPLTRRVRPCAVGTTSSRPLPNWSTEQAALVSFTSSSSTIRSRTTRVWC